MIIEPRQIEKKNQNTKKLFLVKILVKSVIFFFVLYRIILHLTSHACESVLEKLFQLRKYLNPKPYFATNFFFSQKLEI